MYTNKVINLSLLVLSDDFEMHNCKVLNYGNHDRNYKHPFGMVIFLLLFSAEVHLIFFKGLFKEEFFVLPFVWHLPKTFTRVLGAPKRNESNIFPQVLFPRHPLMQWSRQPNTCLGHSEIFYTLLAFPGAQTAPEALGKLWQSDDHLPCHSF